MAVFEGAEALPDELARYGVEVGPLYQRLRGLLVQLAGLLILAQNPSSRDWPDDPTLAAARERLQAVRDEAARVRVPARLAATHARLTQCIADLDWAAERTTDIGGRVLSELDGRHSVASRLERAYRALQHAANEELGFAMVDLGQGCCCAAPHPPGESHAA